MIEKPYAPSCERNQDIILETLKRFVPEGDTRLLEIGSGTGQHAIYCAPYFSNLTWFTSDRPQNHSGIKMWLEEFKIKNIEEPLEFEVGKSSFPNGDYDIIFTANTLHIMSWSHCENLVGLLGKNLKKETLVLIYGPFNYNGRFTSESNEKFDKWLKDRDPQSGVRDFEKVQLLFEENGFQTRDDIEMPANNRFLVFCKATVSA